MHRQHSDNRSVPTDQQGLGRPKAVEAKIDQQWTGCQEHLAQSGPAGLKFKQKIHTQIFQHAEWICAAALIFIRPICQLSKGRSKEIANQPDPLRKIHLRVEPSLHRFVLQMGPKCTQFSRGWI